MRACLMESLKMNPYYEHESITIYHGDCREILPSLPIADLVLTDPPYGADTAKRKAHRTIRDNPAWPSADWDSCRHPELVRLAIEHGKNAMVWGGNFYTDVLSPSGAWLGWIKPEAETGFTLADMELCWSNGGFSPRVKTFNRRDGNFHPTQKPLIIMRWCLGFFPDAKTILDPFMGSGTTLRAAKDLGRKAIGIEIEERYCKIAAKRMSQEVLNFGEPS